MNERSELIEWLRGELVGPARPVVQPTVVEFVDDQFHDDVVNRVGPIVWRPAGDAELEEVLYYSGESPQRKYGTGLLHPATVAELGMDEDRKALHALDRQGIDPEVVGSQDMDDGGAATRQDSADDDDAGDLREGGADEGDDFEVTSPDVRYPSTVGISFCVRLEAEGRVDVRLPRRRRFEWQAEGAVPFLLNGRYQSCERSYIDDKGGARKSSAWRRLPAVPVDAVVRIQRSDLEHGRVLERWVPVQPGSGLALRIDAFPRRLKGDGDRWLLTVVLRNKTAESDEVKAAEAILYQAFFEIDVHGGSLEKYPESERPFQDLDSDEQSLALLYRESATWGIGHGCSAGWEAEPGGRPLTIYADVMPAVQLPSMTPDIEVDGQPVKLSMRELAELSDTGSGAAWESLKNLIDGYREWIAQRRGEAAHLTGDLAGVAARHLDHCEFCLGRINSGITLLRNNENVRRAFRLANLAMLLQQIATKQLGRRALHWDAELQIVSPEGACESPWNILSHGKEDKGRIGSWRAFQIAFLLMSLDGVQDGLSIDRETVDLIWFPTGGGKTEAYLGVAAFYMFHQRLVMGGDAAGPRRDGTNVLMRYTLRMLTTQQFQRAASLICAMEHMRCEPEKYSLGPIPGARFSLGLWIGGEGSPNTIVDARRQFADFRSGELDGNPLVITECPWCRAEIGRAAVSRPAALRQLSEREWNGRCTRGITDNQAEGPRLQCPDSRCHFGSEFVHLPVEVIDERMYKNPPSLVIATADKLAIIAYRNAAGALFGRRVRGSEFHQDFLPPGLIIQDELHLISGPLGTMYALYEGVIERLCSYKRDGRWIKPKIIASTATIRGAAEQVKALYARVEPDSSSTRVQLFPSPGLTMGDSFFGKYARDDKGILREGRLYLGIHASEYGSVLTTQVRSFSAALFRPWSFEPSHRDPWWTLLAFYNSIRELGGAKTLFDSDIRSRLKFLFSREGFGKERRTLQTVEELTSRLSQADIVRMMDRLSVPLVPDTRVRAVDACLASNIIEVGVDIERLSLMGVVGQPKSTATYIQVTGRVGRRWWERPGLILMIYNPSKSRDRSHFEQFHSYHRRLYERVEPTTATPFATSTIQRGLAGALILWARQHSDAAVGSRAAYAHAVETAYEMLCDRCRVVQTRDDQQRSLDELKMVRDQLMRKWSFNPLRWEEYPQKPDGEYLMLWPGQYATARQLERGITVPSSMRQVDRSAELNICSAYGSSAAREEPTIDS